MNKSPEYLKDIEITQQKDFNTKLLKVLDRIAISLENIDTKLAMMDKEPMMPDELRAQYYSLTYQAQVQDAIGKMLNKEVE
jgi:hypothetical protein